MCGPDSFQEAATALEAADAALLWGGLTALLGAPAPKSVRSGDKTPRRRKPVNLWRGSAAGGDLGDIVSLSKEDTLDELDTHSMPSLPDEEIQLEILNGHIDPAFSTSARATHTQCDKDLDLKRPSCTHLDSTIARVSRQHREAATATTLRCASVPPRKECAAQHSATRRDDIESRSIDAVSIDLHKLEDAGENDAGFDTFGSARVGLDQKAVPTLAWGAFGVLLGSSAPTLVLNNRKVSRQAARNLWNNELMEYGDLDLVPSIDADGDKIGGIPSVLIEEPLDDCVVADLE